MRTALIFTLATFFTISLAFAQAGPKQKAKPKKKKAPVEKKVDSPKQEEPANVQPAQPKAPPADPKPKMPFSDKIDPAGPLARALFTTAIEAREPVDRIDSLATSAERVYFFTDIVGLQGQTVIHRWTYNDEVKAEVPIKVRSPRWRAYSSKKLLPGWTGDWKVEVVDTSGTVLGTRQLIYY